MAGSKMKAVVFKEPFRVAVEDRPIPETQHPSDVIVKISYTALCGSDLHIFRGLEEVGKDFIMGHEFTGTVEHAGDAIGEFKNGDKVVAPFTTTCGKCFYCDRGHSARCEQSQVFGIGGLGGGQAEYVRVPLADSTLFKVPTNISDKAVLLMADIFPTGYFAVKNALNGLTRQEIADTVAVVIGCGPVGLCAIVNATRWKPKHVIAVDSVHSRLDLARSLGAEVFNFQTEMPTLKSRIAELTGGRGADVVIEVVGLSPALRTAFDLLRPFGFLSSVGVHNAQIPWCLTATEGYNKNLRLQMGRCPVRSIFQEALVVFAEVQEKFTFMFENILPLQEAEKGYELFNQMKVQKVIFDAQKNSKGRI